MPIFSDLRIVVGQEKKTYQGNFPRCRRTLWVSSAEDPSATVHGLRVCIRQVNTAYARVSYECMCCVHVLVLTMGTGCRATTRGHGKMGTFERYGDPSRRRHMRGRGHT